MPVERRNGVKQTTAILIGVVSVAISIALVWVLVTVASRGDGPVKLNLGEDVFRAGEAQRLSKQIAADGPLLFSDVSGRGQVRPIFVNHFGDDPQVRWVAFEAVAPGAAEGCFLSWSAKRNLFEERAAKDGGGRDRGDLCRDVTYAANGDPGPGEAPLTAFPWHIDSDKQLIIDLKTDAKGSESGG